MNYLFVHQNFPGQYRHLVRALAAKPGNRVVFITQRANDEIPGVKKIVYRPSRLSGKQVHHYLRGTESHVLNAQAVAREALALKKSGFVPDVMLGHNGWGEIWYLKDVFPETPLVGYFEFFYHAAGADVGFDSDAPVNFDLLPKLRTKNLGNLLGLDAADVGVCPTEWQKSLYPRAYHPLLKVLHEGIDTDLVTYVARNLEPYRGFPSFMRALPAVLEARPDAHIVIVGGDQVSYGTPASGGLSYRERMLDELGASLDVNRVHFLGRVPYTTYLKVLQISAAHVYLTYPFVLSWSMLEAMAAECLVIGSDTAPVNEVLRDGFNGLEVEFFDHAQISTQITQALERPALFREMRIRARQHMVSHYDTQRVCLPMHYKILDSLISSRLSGAATISQSFPGSALATPA